MINQIQEIIENELKSRQIKEYEVYIYEDKFYENIILKNKVDNEREGKDFEYIIRILNQEQDKTGIGVTKGGSLNINDINKSIDLALKISRENIGLKYHFPLKKTYKKLDLAEKRIIDGPNEVKNEITEELLDCISQQQQVNPTFARVRIHVNDILLCNSEELLLATKRTKIFLECSLKSQNSTKLSEYWPYLTFKNSDQLELNNRVPKWAKFAYDTLNAKNPPPKSKAIVIFSPQLIENALYPVLDFHSSAKAYQEKMSLYNPEDKVASNNITVIDNGVMQGGLYSNSWDGEGNPCQSTTIIEKGLFKNRLYDQKYALLEGKESTGNGVRNADGSVGNGISNLEILQGQLSLDEIISEIDTGYFIDSCAWLRPSPLSGDFGTLISNGYYIENGKFQYPIQGGNVSGNVHKMLKKCKFISKERDFAKNCLLPYIAFSDLTISY